MRVARLKARVRRLKTWVERLKARVETIIPRVKQWKYKLKEKTPSSKYCILRVTKDFNSFHFMLCSYQNNTPKISHS